MVTLELCPVFTSIKHIGSSVSRSVFDRGYKNGCKLKMFRNFETTIWCLCTTSDGCNQLADDNRCLNMSTAISFGGSRKNCHKRQIQDANKSRNSRLLLGMVEMNASHTSARKILPALSVKCCWNLALAHILGLQYEGSRSTTTSFSQATQIMLRMVVVWL